MVVESGDLKAQQSSKQDLDPNDGGTPGNEHLQRGIHIQLNCILFRRQVLNNSCTLHSSSNPLV